MSDLNCCGFCKFWEDVGRTRKTSYADPTPVAVGRCRVNPPTADDLEHAVWPETVLDDWCGSFVRREESKTLASVTFPPMTRLTLCKLYADGLPWDKQLGPPPDEQGTRVPAEIWEEATKGRK